MTRAWFLWFMMSPGPIDGVVAPLFTIALLFILCNKWLQFNHQSKLLKHLVGNCDVTVVVSMATAIPSGRLIQREPGTLNPEHPGGQECAPASGRGPGGQVQTHPRGQNPLIAAGYNTQSLLNWDVGLNFASLGRLADWFHCKEIFTKNSHYSAEMESKIILPAQFYFVYAF